MNRVLITGASSGIGKATAELFLERGWRVIMVDRNEDNELNSRLKEKYKENVYFYLGDVSQNDTVMLLFDFVLEKFGGIDSIINNAGIIQHGYLHQVSAEQWDDIFNTDVKSVYLMTKFFVPDMIKQGGGTIVNTASISGLRGDYQMPVYNAAKGAVVNLTRSMALDYGEFGIRTNSICPSAIRTPLIKDSLEPHIAVNPMKRIGEPIEAAKAIYFLASDESGFINGVNLAVTGGLEAATGQPK